MLFRLLVLLLAFAGAARAQTPPPSPGGVTGAWYPGVGCGQLTAPGSARPSAMTVDGAGNLCGAASGYDSGAVTLPATPANSSHAAGTSVGGLFTIPLARIAGGSGILTSILWKSNGGSTGTLALRIWQKNPVNTTCTDNVAFAGADADDVYLIGGGPVSLVPVAPAVTTGDTATYAALTGLTYDYKNVDTTLSQNLYACAVTVAPDTADQNKVVRLSVSGPQN